MRVHSFFHFFYQAARVPTLSPSLVPLAPRSPPSMPRKYISASPFLMFPSWYRYAIEVIMLIIFSLFFFFFLLLLLSMCNFPGCSRAQEECHSRQHPRQAQGNQRYFIHHFPFSLLFHFLSPANFCFLFLIWFLSRVKPGHLPVPNAVFASSTERPSNASSAR